ncbi:MAG TPA: response regulator [Candidatus Sulfotelmatobacter sp.]|nr:response regulator [Candidatus Sulfotelmatobacter sp.]
MPRILVADDNTNIQKMVSLAFAERGVDVVAVGNGEAAVRRIPDASPDLVLADVFMPVRNGYEVCEFVKKDTRFAHVPVILLVGAFDPLDEKEARRVGADGVLKKPFVPPDPLIAMVMSALEKNPKVAAELAKAKEVRVEAPEPPPVALENPAMAEPKPLPEFPEPSPEEAAAIYGFGKGVRSLDDIEEKAAKEPKPPAKGAEEEEEEFDGAATARDWRRTGGMDFDIPENTAADPGFSFAKDQAPITFPSEKDVPPKRVRAHELKEEQEEATEAVVPARMQQAPGKSAPPPPAPDSFVPTAVASEQEPEPEPDADRSGSWMDAISGSATADSTDGRWLSRADSDYAPTGHTEEPPAPAASTATPAESSQESPAEGDAGFFAEEPEHKKSWFTDAVAAVREVVHGITHEASHEPEPQPEPLQAESSQIAYAEESHEEEVPPPVREPEPEPEPVATAPSDSNRGSFDPNAAFSAPVSIHAYKEPELEEPPPAHVTREPLLVNEETSHPSEYGKRPEFTSSIPSFLPPPMEPPATRELAREDARGKSGSPTFGFSHPPADPGGFEERIPTAPPPNREALSGIPFLMPPAADSESEKVDSGTVDAVVQKVVERLEPQLHDLLSKGLLKPLVENLLRDELSKKEK